MMIVTMNTLTLMMKNMTIDITITVMIICLCVQQPNCSLSLTMFCILSQELLVEIVFNVAVKESRAKVKCLICL